MKWYYCNRTLKKLKSPKDIKVGDHFYNQKNVGYDKDWAETSKRKNLKWIWIKYIDGDKAIIIIFSLIRRKIKNDAYVGVTLNNIKKVIPIKKLYRYLKK